MPDAARSVGVPKKDMHLVSRRGAAQPANRFIEAVDGAQLDLGAVEDLVAGELPLGQILVDHLHRLARLDLRHEARRMRRTDRLQLFAQPRARR